MKQPLYVDQLRRSERDAVYASAWKLIRYRPEREYSRSEDSGGVPGVHIERKVRESVALLEPH
jgi:hypothetical protein